ncbi:hypothetical protein FHW67_002012 [Herbaspirillum sp. Sphag1AN]|uniref:DUF3304 domain-containing protein n=1 Tax=unclassified Herbaspirillum TaxID=2624150 RepID=UPI001620F13F|nr:MULTISPECIES: DUF3304 domain-containing protein [unclassified Herbaspirillum]MBB3212729.1 hypothetical protein [Herbaspirillum sp. Sphag1AN]MBB3245926.1 hypothetical protein [Herbaspirillum sp. Sphag64]
MRVPIFNAGINVTIKKMVLIVSLVGLAGCNTTRPITTESNVEKPYVHIPRSYVSMSCIEHEGVSYIYDFSIEEPIASGPLGGRMVHGSSCGGLIAAGYALPKTWHPGMKVKVRWKPNGRDYVEKTTNIMRYDAIGDLYVHFFKDDQVRVVSALPYPESKNHPILENVTVPPPEEE